MRRNGFITISSRPLHAVRWLGRRADQPSARGSEMRRRPSKVAAIRSNWKLAHRSFDNPRTGRTAAKTDLQYLDLGASPAAQPCVARFLSAHGAHVQPPTRSSLCCRELRTDATPSTTQAFGPAPTVSAADGMVLMPWRMRFSQLDAASALAPAPCAPVKDPAPGA